MNTISPKIKILVVEDNEDFRRLLTLVLEAKGYSVQVADNAEKAKEMISHQSPDFDLVISDIKMPGGDGLSLLKFTRDANENSKFILMSGMKIDFKEPQDLQPDDFLMKPFRSADLLKMVDRVCHKELYRELEGTAS